MGTQSVENNALRERIERLEALLGLLGGSSGPVPGAPNAIAYENPAGTNLTTDPNLTAGKLDAFGRPQIWDRRFTARGALFRQGAWEADGDPAPDVKAEGFVTIGSNATNLGPSPTDGGFFFCTPHSFGQYQIRAGINGGNLFPVCAWEDGSADAPGIGPPNVLSLRDDTNVVTLSIFRPTGQLKLHEGPSLQQGIAVLGAGGAVVVPNTLITATTRILLTAQDGGPIPTGSLIDTLNPALTSAIVGTELVLSAKLPLIFLFQPSPNVTFQCSLYTCP